MGTLTPYKGRNNGYFYSAKGNPVYEILDNYFICNIFVELKNQLISSSKDTVKINKIKQKLRNRNIAFLGVIKEAISPIDTAADNAIKELILDYNAFKNIKNEVVFICNSRAAEYALNIIKDKNNLSNTTEYVLQYSRRISKDEKQRQWNEKLKKQMSNTKNNAPILVHCFLYSVGVNFNHKIIPLAFTETKMIYGACGLINLRRILWDLKKL